MSKLVPLNDHLFERCKYRAVGQWSDQDKKLLTPFHTRNGIQFILATKQKILILSTLEDYVGACAYIGDRLRYVFQKNEVGFRKLSFIEKNKIFVALQNVKILTKSETLLFYEDEQNN